MDLWPKNLATDRIKSPVTILKEQAALQDKTIRLTMRDTEVFFDAIENPPLPNEKLLNAMMDYQESFPNVSRIRKNIPLS